MFVVVRFKMLDNRAAVSGKMIVAKKREYNSRKIFWLVVLVLVVVYAFSEPYLENWLGVDLPSIRETSQVAVDSESGPPADSKPSESRRSPEISSRIEPAEKKQKQAIESPANPTGKPSATGVSKTAEKPAPFLKPTGRKNRLRSPAGLIYGMGPGGEHRVQHVLRHAVDDTSRPTHSVFDGDEQEILRLLDEAYQLIKSDSKRVRSSRDKRLDFRVRHVVDMQKRIGYLGGQRGRRENFPQRSKITLILDNEKFVVTAYPDR